MTTKLFPLQCIIPPHMLREIAKRGGDEEREWALRSLSLSGQFRGRREVMGAFMLGAFLLTAPASAEVKHRINYDA